MHPAHWLPQSPAGNAARHGPSYNERNAVQYFPSHGGCLDVFTHRHSICDGMNDELSLFRSAPLLLKH